MATIRTSCPDCGDVEFTTQDIKVEVTSDDGSGSYRFSCPGCANTVVKSAETRTVDLLIASGVEQTYPFTKADLERFARILYDEESFGVAVEKIIAEL